MVDLTELELAEVRRILSAFVPECRVLAYGSRANGNARRYSDLDLAVIGDQPLPLRRLAELRDALSLSRLPMMVDVVDWQELGPGFQRQILTRCEVIQTAGAV